MWIGALLLLWQSANAVNLDAVTQALHENRFPEALAEIKLLLAAHPQDARLWTLQGLAHAGLQDRQSALQDLRHAVSLSPDYLPALKAEAQIEYATHDQRSLPTLEHIARLQPADPVSHAMLAALAYQRQDCGTVVADYRISEAYIGSQPGALMEFGQCLLKTQQPGKAVEVFGKVVTLQPSSIEAHYGLAVADYLLNRSSQALAALESLLSSQDPRILDLASGIYEQMGDTPKAVATLREAIIHSRSTSSLYLHFADLSFAHNSFQVGIDMLNSGLQVLPKSAELYLARGILFVQLGKYGDAEKDFDRATELDPTQSYSSVANGLTQLQESNLDNALALTRIQLEKHPEDSYLWYVKAETLRQKGAAPGTPEFKEALAAAESALHLRPQFPLAEDLLGSLHLQQADYGRAVKCFQDVLQAEPHNESALYHLIMTYRRSGATEKVPDLMKALAQAKVINRRRDEEANRYTFVEPQKP